MTAATSHPTLSPGDRVALLVPGSETYLDTVHRLLTSAILPIPLDPRLTEDERARILAVVRPHRVVADADALAALHADLVRTLPEPGLPLARPMHCTSGTTGTPKGVDSGVLSRAAAQALVDEERALWGFRDDDVHLVLSPLYHSAPLRFALGTRLAGGRVVLPGHFDPVAVTAAIERERPTTMFCVPAHLQRLFAYWDQVGSPDLTGFRLVAHAGAPCPTEVKERLIAEFPAGSTWEFYGSTEGQFTACRSEEWQERRGTVGRARPGRRLSADPDGTLWCVVPEFARFSYFGDPAKTAAAWRETPDGPAFTVGDHGRIDADGYVYLDGRREDLIITGGVNVYPTEVELVLGGCPGVVDVAVYAEDDPTWGQRVCAAVVVAAEDPADEAGLAAYAREHLAPPKRPKTWRFLPELPRTLTGKVRRDQLLPRPSTPQQAN
ncbi:AMP-dependent synthetase [Nocardioides sp. GY 10113]|uniref:class I adenylate-forming enzyme family protein n=1 Tax=Nocardioides sp. GY 10113 TaxID=2569761 RepID=UPI0010A77A03|nr:AMP-binding protein [Nocardioides sp. GY 10113]TIC88570.1 AMP-dependent synthetase [Nocardioides sp. GY 10113]